MGIDTDRFVDNLPQEVLCPICCLVLKEPVCTPCNHYMCSSCWQSWRKGPSKELCPYCCKEIPLNVKPPRSQTIWKLVLNFNVHCPFHRDGCTVIYKLGLEDVHMEKCPYNKDNGFEKEYMDEEIKRNTLNQCTDCLNTIENAKEHDCLSVLLQRVQIQNIQITNLEYENDKLSLRLTTKENAIMDQLLDAENRFNEETLKYERQIRELSTQIAAVEGKLRKRNGEVCERFLKFLSYCCLPFSCGHISFRFHKTLQSKAAVQGKFTKERAKFAEDLPPSLFRQEIYLQTDLLQLTKYTWRKSNGIQIFTLVSFCHRFRCGHISILFHRAQQAKYVCNHCLNMSTTDLDFVIRGRDIFRC